MKGIILAGGTGSRLFPLTQAVCKQLLPIYDKPMIYYPLSVLMLMGITEVLIITNPDDLFLFKKTLGNGQRFGIEISYETQKKPNGIAEALIIAEDFLEQSPVTLILGDNILYGGQIQKLLTSSMNFDESTEAKIFAYQVKDPSAYGVVTFDQNYKAVNIEEKPYVPQSDYAITGLYMYQPSVVEVAKSIQPSKRGELEITDVNKYYLNQEKLKVAILGRGFAWFDAGTHDSLLSASQFIETIESRQGLKIACLEEIALRKGLIDKLQLKEMIDVLPNSAYREYLISVLNNNLYREFCSI